MAFAKRPAARFHGSQDIPAGEENRIGHPSVLIDQRPGTACRNIHGGCIEKRCLRRESPGEQNTVALNGQDAAIRQTDIGLLDTVTPANIRECRTTMKGHPDQSRKPMKRRPRQRMRLRLDHRDRSGAMGEAGQKCGKGNQLRTDDQRPAKGHDAVKGDIGLQRAGGDHAHRTVAGQKPHGAWFFPRTCRHHDTPGLQRLDATRRCHQQHAILPEFHHGMTGADIDTRLLCLPLQVLCIGGAEINPSEFAHAEGRVQAMPGRTAKGRLAVEDHHTGDTARFQFQRRSHARRAAANHDCICILSAWMLSLKGLHGAHRSSPSRTASGVARRSPVIAASRALQ
ncbi:hypothetical protein D3C72_973120 [compost metagenome]